MLSYYLFAWTSLGPCAFDEMSMRLDESISVDWPEDLADTALLQSARDIAQWRLYCVSEMKCRAFYTLLS